MGTALLDQKNHSDDYLECDITIHRSLGGCSKEFLKKQKDFVTKQATNGLRGLVDQYILNLKKSDVQYQNSDGIIFF